MRAITPYARAATTIAIIASVMRCGGRRGKITAKISDLCQTTTTNETPACRAVIFLLFLPRRYFSVVRDETAKI
jgi:hypothetical protein